MRNIKELRQLLRPALGGPLNDAFIGTYFKSKGVTISRSRPRFLLYMSSQYGKKNFFQF
jgi:hypothetical protein